MIVASIIIGCIIAAPLWVIAVKLALIWSTLENNAIWPAAPGTVTTIRQTQLRIIDTRPIADSSWCITWQEGLTTVLDAPYIGAALEEAQRLNLNRKARSVQIVK